MPQGTSAAPEHVSPYFYPPRASQTPWWRRLLRRLEGRGQKVLAWVPSVGDPELLAAASIVPGLGHLLLERRPRKAAALFCAYWLLLLWGALFSQLDLWVCSLGVFSFHQWMMTDCHRKARAKKGLPVLRGKKLVLFSLATGLALGLVYRQAGRSLSEYGTVLKLQTDRFEPMLAEGDRLLIVRQARYRRGDIVYSAGHGGLERVVGLGGDRIAVADGRLLVNGAPPVNGEAPLASPLLSALQGGDMTVPPDSYCVFFPARSRYLSGNVLLRYFMIPAKDLDGRMTLRYYPGWERFR